MIILHCADLHLGKSLHERSLIPEQAHALESLLEVLLKLRASALLVAGDIFDRSIPGPEAMALLDSFLSRALAADPGLSIVLIPGNHDSASRLAFCAGLLCRSRLFIRGDAEGCDRPILLEQDGEKASIWALPFLSPGSLPLVSEDEGGGQSRARLRTQEELFRAALARIQAAFLPESFNILLAHCFASGGSESGSERSFVGTAEMVDASLFDSFDYAALGHLHRPQAVGSKGHYAGSLLAYSFEEAGQDRGFLKVEFEPGTGRRGLDFCPIKPLRSMRRLHARFAELAAPGAFAEYRDDFIQARLSDPAPVLNPMDALRANFPNILSLRQDAFELPPSRGSPGTGGTVPPGGTDKKERQAEGQSPIQPGGPAAARADFAAFHEAMRGEKPETAALDLFDELLSEAERETL